jgi:pyruvate/2-oxoglutarate dehydrogenase complex dihydrolipoamide acyltransferase (E2) component
MDPTLVLISVCGLSIVCVGLIGVGAVLLLRFTGRNLFEGVGGLEGVVGALAGVGDEDVDSDYDRLQRRVIPRKDLRAEAQSLDFQSTVEKYRSGQAGSGSAPRIPRTPSTPPPSAPPPSAPPAATPFDEPPSLADRSARRRRRPQGEDEDGLMGSFIDDGDGPL